MASPFGLPSNYVTNPMYLYYMQMMMQNMQQQMQLQRQRQEAMYAQQQALAQQQSLAQQNAILQQQSQVGNTQVINPQNNTQEIQATQQIEQPQQIGDGIDDGKISFGKKLKNFGKGVVNFFKGMVCDKDGKFSLKRTLTSIAVAAGAVALSVATGGAATPFLIAAGATLGAVQTGKGIYKAAKAKTDAEAELAWQEIGSGTTALVGSIAGAKGALKVAGKIPTSVPKGPVTPVSHQLTAGSVSNTVKMANTAKNAWAVTKDSLAATKECFKIAGKGSWEGMKGIAHPFKSGRQIQNYWKTTARPNLEKAFSYKNGYKNFTEANELKLRKNLSNIESELKTLNAQKAKNPSNIKLQEQIDKLNIQKQINELELNISKYKFDKATYKKFNKMTEEQLKNLKEVANGLNGETKAQTLEQIKNLENFITRINKQSKIGTAQENVIKAEAEISRLKNIQANTIAEKETIASRIAKLEKIIVNNKKILRNANYEIAARKYLPKVGLAYGSYYLAGRNPEMTISEADAYAQAYGFANAEEMQNYINSMQANESAMNGATQNIAQTANQQYNPYTASVFQSQMQAPIGNNLGFNELYVSPIPDLI